MVSGRKNSDKKQQMQEKAIPLLPTFVNNVPMITYLFDIQDNTHISQFIPLIRIKEE